MYGAELTSKLLLRMQTKFNANATCVHRHAQCTHRSVRRLGACFASPVRYACSETVPTVGLRVSSGANARPCADVTRKLHQLCVIDV